MQSEILKTNTYYAGSWVSNQTSIICEQPVTLTVNNEVWLTFMCTPIELKALGIGFLYNEKIINCLEDIASARVCKSRDNIDIWLNRTVEKPERWIRTSGCSGGKTSIAVIHLQRGEVKSRNGFVIPAKQVNSLIVGLIEAQRLYKVSGGVHTSALSDGEKIILTTEDIGRHNTLDKLAGRILLDGIKPEREVILTTGRISSEMIQKAERIGANIVISRTSPSSLSVQIAEELGITLIGYARRERFTIYTCPERVLSSPIKEKINCEAK